jgi:hypothetical protein
MLYQVYLAMNVKHHNINPNPIKLLIYFNTSTYILLYIYNIHKIQSSEWVIVI